MKLFFYFMLLLAAIAAPFSQNSDQTVPIDSISQELQLDVSAGTVLENRDTHGGFHGDGESVVVISFSPEDYASLEGAISTHWKPLPLTENLNRCMSLEDENGNPLLSPVEHGYYLFLDRHSESIDPYDDSALFSRYSFNYTLAILDADAHTLSYLRYDT